VIVRHHLVEAERIEQLTLIPVARSNRKRLQGNISPVTVLGAKSIHAMGGDMSSRPAPGYAYFVIALRRVRAVVIAIAVSIVPVRAETLVFHASASGKQTLDQGEGGGNPFASSLVEILKQTSVKLSDLPAALQRLTAEKSRGFQSADVPKFAVPQNWLLVPARLGESRVALVIVMSDYAKSGGAQSLPGAKHDAERIASALKQAGFTTEVAVDLDLRSVRAKLTEFATRSNEHDAAIIYTTGHGVEVGGKVFLLPGDYPISERNSALAERAVSLSEIGESVRAKQVNLVFYGGCRDNPFGE
jgi:hypothetical protein